LDRKKTIPLPDGRRVEGTVLGFKGASEPWTEYLVDDGTVIRIKIVATEVVRIDGEYDPTGEPLYFVGTTNVMAVSAIDELRRKD
jgi:hypothetical protein